MLQDNNKQIFNNEPLQLTGVFFFILLSVVTFLVDYKTNNLHKLKSSVYSNLLPLRLTYKIPGYIKTEISNSIIFNNYLKEQNSKLLKNNLLLKASILGYDALALENTKLKKLLNNDYLSEKRFKLVDVVDDLSTDYIQKLVINMGFSEGLKAGMPVAD